MAELISIYSKILTRTMIILGIISLIGTIFTRLLLFKIILGADILFWIAGMILYVCSKIEFKMSEKKDKGDD